MKAFLFLIVLGLAAWYGYQHYYAHEPGEERAEEQSLDEALAAVANAEDQDTETPSLPQELQKRRAAADARWSAIEDSGANPSVHEESPALALDYSAILKGLYDLPESQDLQQELIDTRLAPLAKQLFFSRILYRNDATGIFDVHTLQAGELLPNLGRTYGLSFEFLNIMRGAAPDSGSYGAGQTIKVVHAKERGYEIHIDKSDFRMDLFVADLFARRFTIGIGKEGFDTPTGETHIDMRLRGEEGVPWTDPETGTAYQAGEAGNILGHYWLRFHDSIGRSGLGIHGYTGNGIVTGAKVSNGCIRLANEDAAVVYNLLVPCQYARSDGSFITRAPMQVFIRD